MKYVVEELRLGEWEQPFTSNSLKYFDEWAEADKFINRLLVYFPLRQFRIVEVEQQEIPSNERT